MTMRKEDAPVYGTRTRIPERFRFACHPGVSCFNRCCHDVDMYLYPYDIIRLKRRLEMTSDEVLDRHTVTAIRDNPFFPHMMLKLTEKEGRPCPFLSPIGCTVYEDRPFSCRAYPVEPAVSRQPGHEGETVYYISRHHYCQGHEEARQFTVAEWIADQGLAPFTEMNRAWVPVDTILRQNPWKGQGLDNPAAKMVFMACYNMDRFREFVFNSSFLSRFAIPEDRLAALRTKDEALLRVGFDWVIYMLTGGGPLLKIKI